MKADVQILTLEISLPSDRYTPVSGHHADTMLRGRYRPKADIADQFNPKMLVGIHGTIFLSLLRHHRQISSAVHLPHTRELGGQIGFDLVHHGFEVGVILN